MIENLIEQRFLLFQFVRIRKRNLIVFINTAEKLSFIRISKNVVRLVTNTIKI